MRDVYDLPFVQDQYFAEFGYTGRNDFNKYGKVSVYMWVVKDINGSVAKGRSIGEFRDYLIQLSKNRNIVVWFHNLSIQFSFIEHHFLEDKIAQFKKNLPKRYLNTTFGREYTTIRNYSNELYGAEWYTANKSSVSFRDSSKIFPTTLDNLKSTFGIKGETYKINIDDYKGKYYSAKKEEEKQIEVNTEITRSIMMTQFTKYGSIKMTRSTYAFDALKMRYNIDETPEDFKESRKFPTYFDKVFPKTNPDLYEKIRPAYAGGIVYTNPKHQGKKIYKGMTFDKNSLYPYVMATKDYPYGGDVEFEGPYYSLPESIRKEHPLYVQTFHAKFNLKEGGFPSLPKKLSATKSNIYSSDDLHGFGTMTLTNVDMEHFTINYDIEDISFIGGYMWKSIHAPFKKHIDEMYEDRLKYKNKGDVINELMVKYDMNSSYGKFGQSPFASKRIPHLDFEKSVAFNTEAEKPKAKNYLPMAIFITAYARDVLLNSVYDVGLDRIIYIDTDSLHVVGWDDVPIEVDAKEMGKWKLEGKWEEGKFLSDKQYAHLYEDGELIIKSSGLSDEAKKRIKSIDDFKSGGIFEGNRVSKLVRGGYLIDEITKIMGINDVGNNNDILRNI